MPFPTWIFILLVPRKPILLYRSICYQLAALPPLEVSAAFSLLILSPHPSHFLHLYVTGVLTTEGAAPIQLIMWKAFFCSSSTSFSSRNLTKRHSGVVHHDVTESWNSPTDRILQEERNRAEKVTQASIVDYDHYHRSVKGSIATWSASLRKGREQFAQNK